MPQLRRRFQGPRLRLLRHAARRTAEAPARRPDTRSAAGLSAAPGDAPSSPPRRRLPHLLAAVVILAAAVSLVTGAFAYMAAPDGTLIIEQGEASAASGGDDWAPSAEAETEETAAAETQEPRRGSRSHPIPLGEAGEYNGLDSWLYNYRLELMVTGVKRGQEALDAVKAGSQFNDDPPRVRNTFWFSSKSGRWTARTTKKSTWTIPYSDL